MPRRYGKRKSRRRRGKRTFSKKLLRDAKTARIDSAAEKAVQIIAKREAEKLMPPLLIFRRYLFCDYDSANNLLNPALATQLDWGGQIVALAQVPIMDNATIPTYAMQNDPDIRPNPQVYNFGVNVIAPQRSSDGFRRGSHIEIKKIQLGVKAWTDQMGVGVAQLLDNCYIKYAVIAVQENVLIQEVALSSPPVEEVLHMKIWGYSSRLDDEIEKETRKYKVRTLVKGSFRLNYGTTSKNERTREHFTELKRPLRIEYAPGDPATGAAMDQYGQRVVGPWKLYLALRSNVPGTYNAIYKPLVAAYCKLSYSD